MSDMTPFEQLERLLNTKQEEEEALMECARRFEQAQDNVKSIVGTEWLHKFVKIAEQCVNKGNSGVQKTLKENSHKSFVACAFLTSLLS